MVQCVGDAAAASVVHPFECRARLVTDALAVAAALLRLDGIAPVRSVAEAKAHSARRAARDDEQTASESDGSSGTDDEHD